MLYDVLIQLTCSHNKKNCICKTERSSEGCLEAQSSKMWMAEMLELKQWYISYEVVHINSLTAINIRGQCE